MAALAVLIVEMASERLLVTESDLFDLEFNLLMRLICGGSHDLVAASHASERNVGGDLSAGIGESVRRIEDNSGSGENSTRAPATAVPCSSFTCTTTGCGNRLPV